MAERKRKLTKITFADGQTITGWTNVENTDYCKEVYATEDGPMLCYIEAPTGTTFEDVFVLPTKTWALVEVHHTTADDENFVPYILGRDGYWHEVSDPEDAYTSDDLLAEWPEQLGYSFVTLYEGKEDG